MILFKSPTSFCFDAKGTKNNFIEAPTLSKIQVNLILLSLKRRIQDYARFAQKITISFRVGLHRFWLRNLFIGVFSKDTKKTN
ncbi:hypothetical protein D0T49_05325 [Paludibacter sp. 221]|nr:hypothetical protein [Paludibacter sp. 221]